MPKFGPDTEPDAIDRIKREVRLKRDYAKRETLAVLKRLREKVAGMKLGAAARRVFDQDWVDGTNDTVKDIIAEIDDEINLLEAPTKDGE